MEILMSYVKIKTKTKSPCITFQEANYFLNMFCHEYRGSTKYSDILEDMEYHYNKPASSKVRKLLSKRLNNINRISQDFLWCVEKPRLWGFLVCLFDRIEKFL